MIVIPDNRLWIIKYDENGYQTDEIISAPHISFFIDKLWEIRGIQNYMYRISHLRLYQYHF